MKILFIVFNIVGRGTYLRAHALAGALTELGHNITLLASAQGVRGRTRQYVQDGINIIEISDLLSGPLRSGWDIKNMLSRVNTVKQLDFDLVHGFESRPTVIYPALALHKQGVPLFLDWADWFGSGGSIEARPHPLIRMLLRPFEDYYETHFRKTPRGTTVICSTLKQRLLDLEIAEEALCLLPNGFNIAGWEPIPLKHARSTVNLDPDQFLVGYLGSFFPQDADLTVETVNQLTARDQKVQCLHVGHSNYHIKHKVNNPQAVIETGPVSFQDMQTYLSACDVLVLPFKNSLANQGRFPLKFSNYLACGRPILATDVGDIPGYIRDHHIGLVTEDSPTALAEAIMDLQAHPDARSEMGKSALKLAQDPRESWLSRGQTLLNFYSNRIEGKP